MLVADLHGLADRSRGDGHEVTWDAEFPGHDRFYVSDPFGNRLEFIERCVGGKD